MRLKFLFLGMCVAAFMISCNNDVVDPTPQPGPGGIVESKGIPTFFTMKLPKQSASTRAGSSSLVGIPDESNAANAAVFVYKMDPAQNIFPENYSYIPSAYDDPVILKTTDGTKKIFVAVNIGPAGNTFFNGTNLPAAATPTDEGDLWGIAFNALPDTIWTSTSARGWDFAGMSGIPGYTLATAEGSSNGLIKAFAGGTTTPTLGLLQVSAGGIAYNAGRLYLMSNWDNGDPDNLNPSGSADYISTCIFTFAPDVSKTAATSQTPEYPKADPLAIPAVYDTAVVINVQRAVAKATLKFNASLLRPADNISYISDGDDGDKGYFTPWGASTVAPVSAGKFVAGNISKISTVFQRFTLSSVSDLNYGYLNCDPNPSTNPAGNMPWYRHFDNIRIFGTGNVYRNGLTVSAARTAMLGNQGGEPNAQNLSADTVYLTENAQSYSSAYQDNSTFLAVGGKYNPRYWITNIVQAPVITNSPIIAYNDYLLLGTEAQGTSWGNNGTYDYPYVGVGGAGVQYNSSPASNDTLYYHAGKKLFFLGKINLYRYYAWVDKLDTDTPNNPGGGQYGPGTTLQPDTSTNVVAVINADFASKMLVPYYQGNCWYRVFITDQDPAAKPNERVLVRRNHFYDVNITKILGPGIPDPNDIIIPGKPVLPADTYISVTINIQEWHKVVQNTDVKNE